jgi:MFS family permease
LVLFTKIRLHLDAVACGRCFGYLGLVLVAMQGGLTHRLTQRFGEARLIIWGMGCVATALLAIPYTPEDQIVWLFPWLTLMAIGQGLLSPSLNSLLSKHAPANAQGSVLGLGQSLSSLARVLGPQIGGIAFDWGGENWPFWLGGGVIAIAFGGAWNYFGKKQQ